jgi:hypothetical protein
MLGVFSQRWSGVHALQKVPGDAAFFEAMDQTPHGLLVWLWDLR